MLQQNDYIIYIDIIYRKDVLFLYNVNIFYTLLR